MQCAPSYADTHGNMTGFPWRPTSEKEIESLFAHNVTMTTSGYPGDKPFGTMWRVSIPNVTNVDSNMMSYMSDTFGGQSGSPVYLASGSKCKVSSHWPVYSMAKKEKKKDEEIYFIWFWT